MNKTPDMLDLRPLFDDISNEPLVIAGPCSAESALQVLDVGKCLKDMGVHVFRAGLWKPRTRPGCFEGVGEDGLPWLVELQRATGLKVMTEVASAAHVHKVMDAGLDGVWLGARTVTNPFAVQEIADALHSRNADIAVLVKNPMTPDIALWTGALERLNAASQHKLAAVHRGFGSYGSSLYRNPPHWAIPIELKRRIPGLTLLHDPSHTSGKASGIATLCREAMALRFDGLMIEVHSDPSCALSDAAQQITPMQLGEILDNLMVHTDLHDAAAELDSLRAEIDTIDSEMVQLLARRMQISRDVGEVKRDHHLPVIQKARYAQLMSDKIIKGDEQGLDSSFLKRIFAAIHEESVNIQLRMQSDSSSTIL